MRGCDLAEKALAVYNAREHWTYCQGALGQLGESDRVHNLYDYFRAKGGNTMTMDYNPWLEKYGRGKHCTDCSNFINYLLGFNESRYSTADYARMAQISGNIADAPLGAVLCMDGHVGLVVDKNTFVDFYAYNNTCRKGKISESMFKKACYIKGVDYKSENPTSIKARATDKKRYIGDVLAMDDFVVTATYKDGTTATVSDFAYTPYTLSNTVNVVAVVYCGLVDYVVIPAEIVGTFYGVQIPATSKDDALQMQKDLTLAGYSNVSVVEMSKTV